MNHMEATAEKYLEWVEFPEVDTGINKRKVP
jgi:hypothetical protein